MKYLLLIIIAIILIASLSQKEKYRSCCWKNGCTTGRCGMDVKDDPSAIWFYNPFVRPYSTSPAPENAKMGIDHQTYLDSLVAAPST